MVSISPDSPFRDAAALWLKDVASSICPTTFRCYEQYVQALDLRFRNTPLCQISLTDIQRYQVQRLEGDRDFVRKRRPQDLHLRPCPVRPRQVNHELQTLARILTCANLSTGRYASRYCALPRDRQKPPFALTEKEEQRWLDTCRSRPVWMVVYHYTVLCLEGCLDPNEARSLQIGDVDLTAGTLTISDGVARTRQRRRTIPIRSERAWTAIRFLMQRGADIGACAQEHYLFPFRNLREWNAARPMTNSGFKREWNAIRKESRLLYFHRCHLRPTGIVRYAERGMPLEELISIAGELPVALRQHYLRILREGQSQQPTCHAKPIPAFNAAWNQSHTFLMGLPLR